MIDDLTIHITATEPPADGANVTLSYGGATAEGRFSLTAVADPVARLQQALTERRPAPATLQAAGAALFDALLGGQLFRAYTRAVTQSAQQGHNVRLRLHSTLPALLAIPWEYLYDRDQGQWLALRPELSLVRGLPLPRHTPQPVTGPLRVLVMVSDPTDLPPLNSAQEVANLEQIEATGVIELIRIEPTYDALLSALRHEPHVFHFSGHGVFSTAASRHTAGERHLSATAASATPPRENQGMLAFCHPNGTADLIEADRLAPLLAGCTTLGLVLLNACEGAVTGAHSAFAGLTQRLIQQQIPAVLAMQASIWDDHALRFSRHFYAALADGYGIERAVGEGRKAMHEAAYTWGIPAFYLQAAEPFAIQPLAPADRADLLWQKAQQVTDPTRQRQLLEGAVALDRNHTSAQAALTRLQHEAEAAHLYAAAVTYMENAQWRDAQRTLEQIEQRSPNFRDTRARLAEVLGKLPAEEQKTPPGQVDQIEQYRPIFNALQEGRLTIFLGSEVSSFGRPRGDRWVAGLYPPGADDAARALANHLPAELQDATSLLQVSQYTLLLDGEFALYDRLHALYDGDFTPTMLHRLLAELPRRLATKGYPKTSGRRYVLFSAALDDLLERAFVETGQPYHLFAYRPRFVDEAGVVHSECFFHVPPVADLATDSAAEPIEVLEPNRYTGHDRDNHPIIVKLCGRRVTSEPDSVAVTEDHYLNYVTVEKSLAVLPTTLLTQIRRNNLLFFGHSLQPWHLRLLWQRLRLAGGRQPPPRWAIVPDLTHIEEKFWQSEQIEPLVAQPEGVVAYVNDWLETL
ncbi:MAG: CHAT domain-containing protein [Caldilineaceae bacterium]